MQSALTFLLLHGLRVLGVAAVSAVALIAHEYGHLIGAQATGRQTGGWGFRWYGIGVRLEVGDLRSFWPVALAGPAASLAMSVLLAPALATDIPLAHFAFWVNAAMFLVNLFPFGPSDGRWFLKSLKARRASSSAATPAMVTRPTREAARVRPRDTGARVRLGSGQVAWLL